jgi:3-ketosteroid 9alpha-monooxygenase subunit B
MASERNVREALIDPMRAGVSEEEWQHASHSCHELRVARTIQETRDAISIVLEIPDALRQVFSYRPGQFLSFKVPYRGSVLVRSYSFSSSPDTDAEHKVTVKRVEGGRISNWMVDEVRAGAALMVAPPAGLFVLAEDAPRNIVLFSGGSGITPCISIIKSALAKGSRRLKLVYANRDAQSIIFEGELEALGTTHAERLEIVHSLDDAHGFLTAEDVRRHVDGRCADDFYLCGPVGFMEMVEQTLLDLGVDRSRIHIEHFVSPPEHEEAETAEGTAVEADEAAPASILIALDGQTHEVAYEARERVLAAVRRAGLDPPFSCEEGYCSSCMAKLKSGRVVMAANDCLTPELLEEGWILTCQSRCVSRTIRIEYPE